MSTGTEAALVRRLTEYGVCTVLAGWLVTSVLNQHPDVFVFSRLRRLDPTATLLPNWRFFAPNPATKDYHLLHRLLKADGTPGEWSETIKTPPRHWLQMFWFPDRRQGKGLYDICSVLVRHMNDRHVTKAAGYRKLRDLVSVHAAAGHEGPTPQGFQFLLLSHTGFDDEPEPVHLFASGLEPWKVHELAAP